MVMVVGLLVGVGVVAVNKRRRRWVRGLSDRSN